MSTPLPVADSRVTSRAPLWSAIAGLAGCLALYAAMKIVTMLDVPAGRYGKFALTVVTFVAIGFFVGRFAQRARPSGAGRLAATGFGAALLGVAAGVLLWTLLEDVLFSRLGVYPIYQEHSLFPIEIAILWLFGSLPMLAGVVSGITVGRR